MTPRLRSTVRATLVLISLLALMPFVPAPARAIQLRWSTGTADLTVSQDTQALLVVQADSAEVTLPNSWTLQWTADSLGLQFTAFDPNSACLVDTAKVDSLLPPQSPADSAANLVTAYFCSTGNNNAASAYFLVDVPGGGHGKLKVIALDPTDTTQVIESNEATFNGGVAGAYAPLVLSASSERLGTTLTVTAVGSGLAGVRAADISAWDHAWDVPLAIDARSDSALVASATIPVNIPSSILRVSGAAGATSTSLPANTSLQPQNVEWVPSYMQEAFTQQEKDSLVSRVPPNGRIQPKDFAFLYARGKFHLFYIRHNMWDPFYRATSLADSTEKNFGHAVSTDLT